MALDTVFQTEIDLVDNSRILTVVVDGSYAENEFTIDQYEITGADDHAHNHGAEYLLNQLGYSFYDPFHTTRPGSLPAGGVTLATKTKYAFPFIRLFENYARPQPYNVDEHVKWLTLLNIDDRRKPNGHSWGTVRNRMEADTGYFTTNSTHWVFSSGSPSGGFNVELTGAARTQLVDAIALDMSANMNAWDRHAFDPEDGDLLTSDVVIQFCNEVVTALRLLVPNAELGVYAYAGHRSPTTLDCPYLYIQVALGFNDLGIGYPAIVAGWGARAGGIGLRGYGDIAAQNGFNPGSAAIRRTNYLNDYPGYFADGANQGIWETSHNHAINIVGQYALIRMWKDGVSTIDDVQGEIITNVFGGDAKAAEFFDYLKNPIVKFSEFTLFDLFVIADAMQAGQEKIDIQNYLYLIYSHWNMTPTGVENGEWDNGWTDEQDNIYIPRLEELARRWQAMGIDGTGGRAAAYPWIRQLMHRNVEDAAPNGPDRDDLAFDYTTPVPHWKQYPQLPSAAEFAAAKAHLAIAAKRPSALADDSIDNLVVVDTTPTAECIAASQGSDNEAINFFNNSGGSYVFDGPGTVTIEYQTSTGGTQVDVYGGGLHAFDAEVPAIVTWTAGTMFLKGFPGVRLDPDQSATNQNPRWCYIPRSAIGNVGLSAAGRIRLHDSAGYTANVKEAKPPFTGTDPNPDPNKLSPGVVKVDNINTSGQSYLTNVCPFFSSSPYKMLMPKEFAELEFPAGVQISITEDIGPTTPEDTFIPIYGQSLSLGSNTNYSETAGIYDTTTPVAITGATQADPVVISSTAHGLVDGDTVYIRDITGMTEINAQTFEVAGATANTFELMEHDARTPSTTTVDGGAFTAYSSGGECSKSNVIGSHLMFGGGIRAHYDTILDLSANQNQGMRAHAIQELVPAVERIQDNFGQTLAAGALSGVTRRCITAAMGRGAYSVSDLSRDTSSGEDHYTNLVRTAIAARKLATGTSFALGPMIWKQGEKDAFDNATKATYKTEVEALRADLTRSFQTALQFSAAQEVHMITDQMAMARAADTYGDMAVAVLELHRENANFTLAGPGYWHDYWNGNDVHMSPEGYQVVGELFGLALQTILDGDTWHPLHINAQPTRSGTTITVPIYVPTGPMVKDTTLVTSITDDGFEYSGANITSVTITDTGTTDNAGVIEVELDAAVAGTLSYAYENQALDSRIGNVDGARGNIRDSATATALNGDALHNWLCVDQWSVS